MSRKGRFVAFSSWATNLVLGDSNAKSDIFVYQSETGVITRASVATGGAQAAESSFHPAISESGRYVAFESSAENLVLGDNNAKDDIFVHDRKTGVTERVSVGAGGVQSNNHSSNPAISADGRYVAYESYANNLVQGDGNGEVDIFVYDRQKGKTTRVSVSSAGAEGSGYTYGASISANGRFVAFASFSDDLVAGDGNSSRDVFVRDCKKGKTTRVSLSSGEVEGDADSFAPSISGSGRYVAFESWAGNLVPGDSNGDSDVFVHDRKKGKTERVSLRSGGAQPDADSEDPAISGNGRHVAFQSWDALLPDDTNGVLDVYLYDRKKDKTAKVSIANSPNQQVPLNANAELPCVSPEGACVAFVSTCTYVVTGDGNGADDVFLRRCW
ncbi:MAG: PD40 domain-containing protein [Planctomycetes bacterium]|nr:PD40 domain-containing protein [Planctomycetota bacterium]